MPRKFRVELSLAAQDDIEAIHAYIARDKPEAATKWVRGVRDKILSLDTFPERSEIVPDSAVVGQDIRHLLFGNYRIIYFIGGDVVHVIRVIHAARRLRKSMLPLT
jgi:toxin ParE1/3/4